MTAQFVFPWNKMMTKYKFIKLGRLTKDYIKPFVSQIECSRRIAIADAIADATASSKALISHDEWNLP